MLRHKKCHQKSSRAAVVSSDDESIEELDDAQDSDDTSTDDGSHRMPVLNIFDLFKNPAFVEVDEVASEED